MPRIALIGLTPAPVPWRMLGSGGDPHQAALLIELEEQAVHLDRARSFDDKCFGIVPPQNGQHILSIIAVVWKGSGKRLEVLDCVPSCSTDR